MEIGRRHIAQRRAILFKSRENSSTIRPISFDEDVEILGAARFCMDADRMGADYQILYSMRIKCEQKVPLIFEHSVQCLS